MKIVLAALAVLLLGFATAPAQAARPATAEERAALQAAHGGPFYCAVEVSTVDESWAAAVLADGTSCDRATKLLYRRAADGSWGEAGGAPVGGACVDAPGEIPDAVGRDLLDCRASSLRRRATEAELAALAASLYSGRYPVSCWTMRVSLRDERFASATLPDSDDCGEGQLLVSRASGSWRLVADLTWKTIRCRTPGVPEAVMRSLAPSCVVPKPVAAVCERGLGAVKRVRPSSCRTTVGGNAGSLWLVGIRWRSWGGEHARGRGWSRSSRSRSSDRHLPVEIDFFGRSDGVCGPRQPMYTKARVRWRRSVVTIWGQAITVPAGTSTVRIGPPDDC